MEENSLRTIKKTTSWLLLVVTAVYIMTGFGITENRIVEPLTSGLLSKTLSFRVHLNLEIPFMILLLLHISFGPIDRIYRRLTGRKRREDGRSPSQ
ncbi:MAG: hypothetical protein ACETWE_02625 [Candidatus Bathyarchaeia archaeon]